MIEIFGRTFVNFHHSKFLRKQDIIESTIQNKKEDIIKSVRAFYMSQIGKTVLIMTLERLLEIEFDDDRERQRTSFPRE